MIAVCKNPLKWRFGYEKTWSDDLQKTAHWVMLGPVAICILFR